MEAELEQLRRDLETLTAQRKSASQQLAQAADVSETIRGRQEVQRLDREIQETRARLLQLEDKIRDIDSTTAAQFQLDSRRLEREEAAFWFRRFFTTLGIANAAAFAAIASGLLQADDPVKLAPVAGPAMDAFIWGAIWAGTIPLLLWARLALKSFEDRYAHGSAARRLLDGAQVLSRQLAALFAATSTIMFCLGLFTAAGAVHGLAEGKKVADARVAAESKLRVHAPTPARE